MVITTCNDRTDYFAATLPRDLAVTKVTNLNEGGFVNNAYTVNYTVKPKNKVSSFPVVASFIITKEATITGGMKVYTERDTIMFAHDKPRSLKIVPAEIGAYRLIMTFKDERGTEIGTDELNFSVVAPEVNVLFETDLNQGGVVNDAYFVKYTINPVSRTDNFNVTATFTVSKNAKISAGSKQYNEGDTIMFQSRKPRQLKIVPLEPGIYKLYVEFTEKQLIIATHEFNFNIASPDYSIVAETELKNGAYVNKPYQIRYTVEIEDGADDFPAVATYEVSKRAKMTAGRKEYSQSDTMMFSFGKSREFTFVPTETGPYRLLVTFKNDAGAELGTSELNFNVDFLDYEVTVETDLTEGGFANNSYAVTYTVKANENVSALPVSATYTVSRSATISAGAKQYSSSDTIMFTPGKPRKLTVTPTGTGPYRLQMFFRDNTGAEIASSELNFTVSSANFNIKLETNIAEGAFMNNPYSLKYTVEAEDRSYNQPVTATYSIVPSSNQATVSAGLKIFSQQDTIIFMPNRTRELKIVPLNAGSYRFLMTFKTAGIEIAVKELLFDVQVPDLEMSILKENNIVTSLDFDNNFVEYSGTFVVRVTSDNEILNSGNLALAVSKTGAAVNIKNWPVGEVKRSKAEDPQKSVDFLVEYENTNTGEANFVFTATSQRTNKIREEKMTVIPNLPGKLILTGSESTGENSYKRPETLWVGESGNFKYQIEQATSTTSWLNYHLKFEMEDNTERVSVYASNPDNAGVQPLETGRFYQFPSNTEGTLYYKFNTVSAYSGNMLISLRAGAQGPITQYKLTVSSRQTEDFVFDVSFKPSLTEGYDNVLFSELSDIRHPVTLIVTDGNPYSRFDYKVKVTGANIDQWGITHKGANTSGTEETVIFDKWLASTFGQLIPGRTKDFKVATANPSDGHIGVFNWVYDIERKSDGKTKQVIRKVRVVDDRLRFSIGISPDNSFNRQWIYQNELLDMYQLNYENPSRNANDYTLTVKSTNESVADVYIMNQNNSFRKAKFDAAETPPATHIGSSELSSTVKGRIQIKGKQAGNATITFKLTHKESGTFLEKEVTIETKADPLQYVIQPVTTIDKMDKERTAIPFNGQFHTYQNPRFKIRISSSEHYAPNSDGTALIEFIPITSQTNETRLYISNASSSVGAQVNYNTQHQVNYDTDYYVTVSASSVHPWTLPAGTNLGLNIKMTKATDQETKILSEHSNIRYTLKSYLTPYYTVTGDISSESWCTSSNNREIYEELAVEEAGVIIYPSTNTPVIKTECSGTFSLTNFKLSSVNLGEANEANGGINVLGGTYRYTQVDVSGSEMKAMPGLTPSSPGWQHSGPGVRVKTYQSVPVTITDNWGYISTIHVQIPTKIVYGTNEW